MDFVSYRSAETQDIGRSDCPHLRSNSISQPRYRRCDSCRDYHRKELPPVVVEVLGRSRSERIDTMVLDLIRCSMGKKRLV